jgi:hypothetical protein
MVEVELQRAQDISNDGAGRASSEQACIVAGAHPALPILWWHVHSHQDNHGNKIHALSPRTKSQGEDMGKASKGRTMS